jgi:SAM-dependent methyltransferase
METAAPFDRMWPGYQRVIQANDLAFDPDLAAHSSPYGGSQPSIVRRCLATLPDPAEYTFVDLGCGKGRPLLVASEFPFQRVVGVEIAPRLAEIARQNAATLSRQRGRQVSIEVQVGDATTTAAPAVRVVYFLYNPFDAVLIGGVARNIAAQLGERLEHAFIVYYNPVHAQVFDRSPLRALVGAEAVVRPTRSVTALISTTPVLIWQTVPGTRHNPTPGGR